MQYKVPQNVDIEDRVIGNLSLRQFIILLMGIGLLLVLYFILVGPFRIIFWLFALIIGSVTIAFAFVKYGDQKLEIFVMSALKTFTNPRLRVWKKDEETNREIPEQVAKAPEEKKPPKKSLAEAKNDLENLAQLVDSGGYSKLNPKDRLVGNENLVIDDSGAKDIIAMSEESDTDLEKLIETVDKNVQKREPLISDVAGVSPQKDFNYPEIKLKNDNFLADMTIKRF
jgi:hypothetical protein